MKDMIGYCGLDCEKCDAYTATINDDLGFAGRNGETVGRVNNAPFCRNILTARAAV